MSAKRGIGHVEGVLVGMTFPRRLDVLQAGLHRTNQRGISWCQQEDGTKVGDAIVLHGGYEDDEDHWDWIRYTGASPNKDKDSSKRLLRSQSWSYEDNAALRLSYERGISVRVIRGYEGDPRYSPTDCYRYDGLYRITEVRTARSRRPAPDGSPIDICQFDLRRLPERDQVQDAAQQRLLDAWEELDRSEPPQSAVMPDGATPSDAETFCEPGDEERFPTSREERVRRLIRDTAVARRIKQLYEGQCQLCGLRLVGPDGKPYCEGAHIRPLGRPHHGPDVEPNLLCLCPNCHVRLDLGAVLIDDDQSVIVRADLSGAQLLPRLMVKDGHRVHPEYLRYHRTYWTRQG
ncbi:YDG/SRA domain-containing protein [Streptomyces tagetis]|uniref:HNH endonuclease n=1 Tax=Streptomyces tagetis TaxID=2820809 RepID=A0A940XIJ8_9ACTN|nr:YDG/SRA domain-containing protein [Streptomyces sp. RG38]MBQ0829066.1 HNH endonuclease [Streptomyces sp. RG38]